MLQNLQNKLQSKFFAISSSSIPRRAVSSPSGEWFFKAKTETPQTHPRQAQTRRTVKKPFDGIETVMLSARNRTRISLYCAVCWISIAFSLVSGCAALKAAATYTQEKPIVRGVRAFGGGNETAPPIILLKNDDTPAQTNTGEAVGSSFVTVEVDMQTKTFPNFSVQFVHCDALWRENPNNIIINNPMLRTTLVDVRQASFISKYFTHRASFSVPNSEVKFKFSGNWKAKIYETSDLNTPIAEARFFVVEQVGRCDVGLISDLYRPKINGASSAAYILEASIQAPPEYIDDFFQTVMIFRNHRWNEPRIITQNPVLGRTEMLYNNAATTTVLGFTSAQKRFRIAGIPAEHEYRILDISNPAFAPASSNPLRPMIADLRRNGVMPLARDGSILYADDGAMRTRNVPMNDDEYVYVEFVLDPENIPSSQEIFAVGSFNNWQASPAWKLEYNKEERLYKLRQWIRRGRHNYMYATGRINAATQAVENVSFEECEGNTLSTNQTFYALFYYQNPNSGRYDALYGVAAVNARRRTR
jgi:hypothetical protein